MNQRRILRLLGGFVLLWILVAAVLLGLGARDAVTARDHLDAARDNANEEGLRTGAIETNLASATKSLESAHGLLNNVMVQPLRLVPLAGRQISSGIALTDSGATATSVAHDTLQQVRELDAGDTERPDALRRIAIILKGADERLRTIDLGPRKGLVGPIADVRADAVSQLNTIDRAFVRGGAASDALSTLLSRDARYLIVAANNGEMRSGSGMFLQAGLLRTGNNELEVSDMASVSPIAVPNDAVPWPEDIERNWEWIGRNGDFRNLMLSPRYDMGGAMAKQLWEASGRPAVDGVITLDVAMMQALLAVTGEVTVDGQTINAENAQRVLLFDQYRNADSRTGTLQRREMLSNVAEVAFDRFAAGDWSLNTAAQHLGNAAQGRHLLIWSTDTQLNDKWVTAGVGGTMQSGDMMLSLVNLGTNKLDQFMRIDTTMETVDTDTSVDTTLRINVANKAPEEGPRYVLGPALGTALLPGEYRGALSLSLPGDATAARFEGDLPLAVAGPDGRSLQVATAISVPRGNAQKFVLHFSRPKTAGSLTVEPSARIPASSWQYKEDNWTDEQSHLVTYRHAQ